jgi:adenine-specific DNA-methyltransferase
MPKKKEDIKVNRIPATSPNKRQEILDNIRAIYPALIHEDGTVNEKELKALSEGYTKTESERYEFKWAGKTASKRFAFTPSKARLVPDAKRSVDFDNTKNLIIEGENLEVLKLLQSSYFKKVKMIYIDPPYNTGHDFVYSDDYSESKQAYWEQNGVFHDGVRMDTNTESAGRYHSNWLSMMQSRLLLARNLLRDDGVIFVSIDDNEVHNLRKLMDEVFGEENFVAQLIWKSRQNKDNRNITGASIDHEYIVCYVKNTEFKQRGLKGSERKTEQYTNQDNDPRGPWVSGNMVGLLPEKLRPNCHYDLIDPKTSINYGRPKLGWRYERTTMNKLIEESRILWPNSPSGRPRKKVFLNELTNDFAGYSSIIGENIYTRNGTAEVESLLHAKVFDFPKPVALVEDIIAQATDTEDIILDFFAGSGTTAHATMELNKQDGGNRKFILVQLPEETDEKSEAADAEYKIISDITIERVKRAGKKIKAEKSDIDVGFKVYRLSKSLFPHNLFEVDPEMTEEQKTKAWEVYLEKAKQAHIFDYKLDELLVEVALKDGFDLNFKSEPIKEFKRNKVLKISDEDKSAIVCLDETIHEDTVKGLEAYKDQRLICLERAVDTTSKWNLRRMFGENLWVA